MIIIIAVVAEVCLVCQSKIMRFIATPIVKLESKLESAERDLKGKPIVFHHDSFVNVAPAAKETTINCREDASLAEKVFGDASSTLFGLMQELELERLDVVHAIGLNFLKQQK